MEMKDRLTPQDWIEHGIEQLACHGVDALKADLLAKSLGVSRGSFYWHFKNLAHFHQAVLDHWYQTTTADTIQNIDQTVPLADRFEQLVQRALQDQNPVESAVRSWALQDAKVANVVVDVDIRRLQYLFDVLVAAGVPKQEAKTRARLVYWAYLGRLLVFDSKHRDMTSRETAKIAAWFALS